MKRLVFLLGLLSLVMVFSFCVNKSHKEKEPNDVRNLATIINPLKDYLTIATMESEDDKDYFLIDLSAFQHRQGTMNIKVTGIKGIDIRLNIFRENENVPFKQVNDFWKGYGESIGGIGILPNEKYVLLIDSVSSYLDKIDLGKIEKDDPDYPFIDSDEYQIEIEIISDSNYEREPNDIFEKANDIIIGEPMKGYFTPFLEQNPEETYIKSIGNEPSPQIDASDFENDVLKNITNKEDKNFLQKCYIKNEIRKVYNLKSKLNEDDKQRIVKILKLFGYNYYEIDLYKIVSKGKNNEDKFVSIALSDVPNVNSFLVLFNEKQDVLEFVDNQAFGIGEKILNYTLKTNQTYYIGVMGIHTLKAKQTELYEYTLLVDYLDDTQNIEQENNDKSQKANVLVNGMVSGFLSPINDEDWFAIAIPKEEVYEEESENTNEENKDKLFEPKMLIEVKITGIEKVDIALEVSLKGSGIDITYDNNGISEGETISNVCVSELDRLYIRVRRSVNDTLRYVNEQSKYVLSYRFYYQKENMELEPNNQLYQPTPVDINKPIIGYINPKGDVDNYLVKLENSRTYSIQITTVEGVNLEWLMYQKDGLPAPNDKNPNNYEYAVQPKGSYSGLFLFKYIGQSYAGEAELILSVRDYKKTNSTTFTGLGFNTSQMYVIRIVVKD